MHKIKTDKTKFIKNFIGPIADIGEDACVIICKPNLISVVIKGSGILYLSEYECDCNYTGKINISSLNLLKQACNLSPDNLDIEVYENYIIVPMERAKYKMFMGSDELMKTKTFDPSKLASLKFPYNFIFKYEDYVEFRKYSKLMDKDAKVYFYDRDDRSYANLTDAKKSNSNSIEIELPVKIGLKNQTILDKSFLTMITLSKDDLMEIDIEENNRIVVIKTTGNRKYILSTIDE